MSCSRRSILFLDHSLRAGLSFTIALWTVCMFLAGQLSAQEAEEDQPAEETLSGDDPAPVEATPPESMTAPRDQRGGVSPADRSRALQNIRDRGRSRIQEIERQPRSTPTTPVRNENGRNGRGTGDTASPAGADREEQEENQFTIEAVRELLDKYYETERALVDARKKHEEKLTLLDAQISLYEAQIEDMERRITSQKDETREKAKETKEVEEEREYWQTLSDTQEKRVRDFELKVLEMENLLPPPLEVKLRDFIAQVPGKEATDEELDELSTAQRYQTVLAILNETNDFNNNVHVETETREVDGEELTVTTMYVGLAQAYYASTGDQQIAAHGVPTDDGWRWTRKDELYEPVTEAVGMFQGEVDDVTFQLLPAEINNLMPNL